ncbi:MAG: aldo/keto reductase, partial [Thermoproteota archaeon]
MKYVNLGNSGLKVSQICLGSWHLPRSKERDEYGVLKVDVEETKKVVKIAFDQGINFIDTANRYHGAMSPVDFNHLGNAERVLGEVLKDYERESFVIATKVGGQMAQWVNGQGLSRKHIFWQ